MSVPPSARSLLPQRTVDVLAGILADLGVRTVFGLPGGTIAPLYDALLDRPEIEIVTTRHESSAVFAAAGQARLTGDLGVVLVTSGPGITNAMTGLASAHCEGLPVLVLVGEVPRRVFGRRALQEGSPHHLDVVGMTRSITKMAVEIPGPSAAPGVLCEAIAAARSGRPGPVVVTLPLDVATAPASPAPVSAREPASPQVPPRVIEEVASLVSGGHRTVLLAGSGVRGGGGPQRLLAFAERAQLPVVTTPKAKGVFPEDHPLSVGIFGLGGHPSATALLEAGVDVLLAIGTSLGDLATNDWSKLLEPRSALVHVDVDASRIGRVYTTHVGVVAPAAAFLEQLSERIPPAAERRTFGIRRHHDPAIAAAAGAEDRIAPRRALWELQRAMPPDAIYTVDIGEHTLHAVHYLETTRPDAFIVFMGLGSMGSGIGAALGVKLASPARAVVAICGDGGFAMAGTEVSTAAALGLPLIYAVMNDERLGMVELGNEVIYGRTPRFSTGPLDIVAMARALGAEAITIRRPGELLACASTFAALRGPMVLDVRVDPTVRFPMNGRFAALGNIARREAAGVAGEGGARGVSPPRSR
ncbi:thiamine pyrophosphate-binding protein [Sorangium sp. So ce291]|uniref:thiamine pyrophosphate-binding protein n=1 Tax=Sorangium sp. So ce291 TaxID=3133294 RepID=UPI003F62D050